MANISRNEVKKLRDELEKVLDKFNKTSDIKMELGNAKFGDEVTFKFTGRKLVNGQIVSKESTDFLKFQYKHGLKEHALNYEFTHAGKSIKIVGYKPRSPKYSITYEENGRSYKCTVAFMQAMIKTSAQELLF